MKRLDEIMGCERSLDSVTRALHFGAASLAPRVAGALHVTCSDETELECAEAFQRGFAQYLLPSLKSTRKSPFRVANLGGRYEWAAIRIAERHFMGPADDPRLLLVKINSHVAAPPPESTHFGLLQRYGLPSTCCGALHAVLDGDVRPFAEDLRQAFLSEGKDRIAMLNDPDVVPPDYRALFAAVVSARLQARTALLDIQEYMHEGGGPVVAQVVACVTINRPDRDTEMVVGYYVDDERENPTAIRYGGLGDDPSTYRLDNDHGNLKITDDQVGTKRGVRDHRKMVLDSWREQPAASRIKVHASDLGRAREALSGGERRRQVNAKAILKMALPVLAEVAPVPAAVLMFAHGLGGIHHAFRIHQLTDDLDRSDSAREFIDEIHEKLDHLDADTAEALLNLLHKEYAS